MELNLLDKNGVMQYIPHRDPFIFLDSIGKIDLPKIDHVIDFSIRDLAGSSVEAYFTVPSDHPLLQLSADGKRIWPSVLNIEATAQAACFVLQCIESNYGSNTLSVALLSLDKITIHAQASADTKLRINSFCSRIRGNIASFAAKVWQGELLLLEGSFMASFSFTPNNANAPGSPSDSQFD